MGFIVTTFGILIGRNWIIFIGSLFMLLSSLIFLYFLSQGIEFFGSKVSLVSFAGIGVWEFLIGSLFIVYSSGVQISYSKIFYSLIIIGVVAGLLLFNFSLFPELKVEKNATNYSYDIKMVKSIIEETIRKYINEENPWSLWGLKRTIDDLRYFGPSFSGNFNGYNICSTGDYVCDYGREKVENINYLYCRPRFSSYIFCYRKVVISSSGEIQDLIKNCVYSFVLNPKTLEVASVEIGPLHERAKRFMLIVVKLDY